MDRTELLARLRQQRALFDREGVAAVALFGSRARGEAREDSDVDLLISYRPEARVSLLDLARLENALRRVLALPVQVLTEPVDKVRLRRSIEADRINVF